MLNLLGTRPLSTLPAELYVHSHEDDAVRSMRPIALLVVHQGNIVCREVRRWRHRL